jgi:DNA-binding GntR family transcriptional regulator
MRERSTKTDETHNHEKTPVIVIKKIRDLILDETFKPGDWLPEPKLGERFRVNRSPVREGLLALEKEGTVHHIRENPTAHSLGGVSAT